ncbi:putative hydroxylase domain protein [Pseudarthrobacter siccitolerans]|uniref:Putative hydroxylase domain protein n=1 Tax=Pseudarthrobacter siccitolerans TaxID=861266 RepID=A0A024H8N9_9MICC|nr:transposase [Pseudarthrobacter siccitolerans]CCQ48144.1 putative hydroxylase domain protein [Pseudarthrobacter siccitolerans]
MVEIEMPIITGATTGKVEANNTAIKNSKRTARGYRNPENYKLVKSRPISDHWLLFDKDVQSIGRASDRASGFGSPPQE